MELPLVSEQALEGVRVWKTDQESVFPQRIVVGDNETGQDAVLACLYI